MLTITKNPISWIAQKLPQLSKNLFPISKQEKIKEIMKRVCDAKKELFDDAEKGIKGKLRKYSPILIGGDIFTVGYLGVQIASMLGVPGLPVTLCVMGGIAGLITMGVGGQDTYEGLAELKKAITNHQSWRKAIRMIAVGLSEIVLGAFFVIAPLLMLLAAGSAITAFLITNPWFLPLLFVIPTLLMFIEYAPLMRNIITGKTTAHTLKIPTIKSDNTNELKKSLEEWAKKVRLLPSSLDNSYINAENSFNRELESTRKKIEKLVKKTTRKPAEETQRQQLQAYLDKMTEHSKDAQRKKDMIEYIKNKDILEALDATVGIDAALTAFELYQKITCGKFENLKSTEVRDEALKQAENINKKLNHWITIKSLCVAIQIIYIIAFGLSLPTISSFHVSANTNNLISLASNCGLVIANGIPLYLDPFEPPLRNTSFTPPPLTGQRLIEIMKKTLPTPRNTLPNNLSQPPSSLVA